MLEPDVTLTDYVLAAQCLCFALFVRNRANPWFWLFASISVASLAGGTVHGFLPDEQSHAYAVLWRLTLASIGITALAGWYVGAGFVRKAHVAKFIEGAAVLQFCLFSVVILFYSQEFLLAALNYLPSAIFMLAVFLRQHLVTREKAPLWGAAAIALTFAGSCVQIAGISVHPRYFNHNALYHVIQFIALCMLFIIARWDIARKKYER